MGKSRGNVPSTANCSICAPMRRSALIYNRSLLDYSGSLQTKDPAAASIVSLVVRMSAELRFYRIHPIDQTLFHLIMAFSDQCNTFWKVADLNHSMELKKHVKSSLIQSRRSGTSIISKTLWTDGKSGE
ncbi:hypothetical protein KIN20_020036 [Parelaphostrongylus tenuis]|uniref:Uncharacterized protein n=1 Tax=Parelaphostrongylus tenuis TaxID=148309 RepID=A0AAD5MLV5_PARTN|nr:hypothetical protein KIN20_020036 [Parelaphostrongylus tenuis]